VFCAVFTYVVEDREAFERAYGVAGEWASFFRRGEGYLGTELLASGDRYLLIDRWTSRDANEVFLASHRAEYDRRSADCEGLYLREERVGDFVSAPGPAARSSPAADASPPALALRLLPGMFAVCRLDPSDPPPDHFWSLTRTDDELSLICRDDAVPDGSVAERGWRGLQVAGPLDFALTGVAAALTAPLAAAGVSVLPVATYDTDYLFVREETLARAVAALEAAGHRVT
jgi:heme-degrading monooxygenase HmoA